MKVSELDPSVVGRQVRVTFVASSPEADAIIAGQGYPTDPERLTGLTGKATGFTSGYGFAQLAVDWEDPAGGSLFLVNEDEVEVLDDVQAT